MKLKDKVALITGGAAESDLLQQNVFSKKEQK